ncbi:MAG: fasciclin domain-containing protein [Rhizobiaceae bacterium]
MRMKSASLWIAALGLMVQTGLAEEIRMIGNSVMYSSKSILSNVMDSRTHKTLIKAMRSVKLEQPLMRRGSFTLFAPDDAAFAALPADYSDRVFRRINRDEMAHVLACHIVAGNDLAGRKLSDLVPDGGTLKLVTLGGCKLTLSRKAGKLFVIGPNGEEAEITAVDVLQSNGMVQIINRVILPSS